MNKFFYILIIFSMIVSCKKSTINTSVVTLSTSPNTHIPQDITPIPDIKVDIETLDTSTARGVQVLKNGKGLCNSGSFTQLPDNRDYFIGRLLINTTSDGCSGDRWQLGLFKMDWANNVLNFQKAVTTPPMIAGSLGTILSTYDPSIVKYNGEYWLTFECYGTGGSLKTLVSACLVPFTIENGIDLTRLSIPVKGSIAATQNEQYSASVPKLLVHNNSLYLYWTVVIFKELNGVSRFNSLNTRGMQLVQEISTTRKIWGVRSGNVPVDSVSELSSEVLGIVANDKHSNVTMDGFQVLSVGNRIIMTAAVGGQGCLAPNSPVFGCYRLQIYSSNTPLGHRVFNSEVVISPQLAFNPQEYSRIFYTPEGQTFIMGMMLTPFLTGSPMPSNTINIGLQRYPINLSKLFFTTNVSSINPLTNPQSSAETMSMSIDVLENFVNDCHAANTNSLSCRAAVSRYCLNHGYGSGGHGPNDQAPNGLVNFVCLNNSSSKLLVTTLANLKRHAPSCNGQVSGDCNAASNRYCQSIGYDGGGFGPSEFDGVNATITCLRSPYGYANHTTFGVLSSIHGACTSAANVNSIGCNSAVKNFCVSKSYSSGYGILEHSGDAVVVGCAK